MPSTTKRQQRFFGMVEGGELPKPAGMTDEQVKEFASTPTKDLPERAPRKPQGRGHGGRFGPQRTTRTR